MSLNKGIPAKCDLEFNIHFFVLHTNDQPVITNILTTFLLIVMLCNHRITFVYLTKGNTH